MAKGQHDTIAYRLSHILIKLNQGEHLEPLELAEEFGTHVRTIQRDLKVRLAYLPLLKTRGRYHLDPSFLGKLNFQDIERFAGLAGVRGLFPSLSDDFLREIFDSRIQMTLMVKGYEYENLAGKEGWFRLLEMAILERRHVSFDYVKDAGCKRFDGVAPFKLLNQKGIWYLVARDQGKLKSFVFSKILDLTLLQSHFEPDHSVEARLTSDDGVWLSNDRIEIVLRIAKDVAGYFKRRKLIANQVLERELEDGGLIVSAKVAHINQVLPIVRYWIPHVDVVEPEELRVELRRTLLEYLG